MLDRACRLFFVAGLLTVSTNFASAAPPASCAHKFVGTWVYAGGTTIVAPGGTAHPKCAMCVPTQTWTCQGNTYLFSNSGPPGQFSATLTPDGRQLIGGGVVATRVGGAARGGGSTAGKAAVTPDTKEPNKKDAALQNRASVSNAKPPQAGVATKKSFSCSDITGTSSKTPAATHCRTANSALTAARASRETNPTGSANEYKKAANAYRQAGDTAQADAILREAAQSIVVAVAPSPPNPASAAAAAPVVGLGTGASLPPAPTPTAASTLSAPRRVWSGQTEDCDDAGYVDRQTAAWYNMCVPFDAELEKSRPNAYRPPISPQQLTAWAIDQCKDVQWDAKRQCIFDAKLRRLLADDPNVRLECSSKTGQDQIECVDAVFLYGPGASQGNRAERENIKRKAAMMPSHLPDRTLQHATLPAQSVPRDNRCPPGQGMKPTPSAFGAWSCQPLGLIWLAPNRPKPDTTNPQADAAPNAPDAVQAFEDRVNHVAASAVVAGTKMAGAQLSAQEREACMEAAFAAVHSTLKGGAPPVPAMCRPLANAARVELAYYAGTSIDTISNPGVEELLSFLNARNQNSGILNSGVLGPPRQETTTPNADCTQAEAHWKAAEDLKLLPIYEDHLARFPTCNFAAVAAARIEQARKK